MKRTQMGLVIALAAVATTGFAAADTNLTGYTWGASRAAFAALEEQARDAAKRKDVEAAMIELLGDKAATFEAKQYACRVLRVIGTEASVPAVAPLLTDEKLSHYARFALEGNPAAAAGDAIRDALGRVSGSLKAGMITSLGVRRDGPSVPALAALTGDAGADLAAAAMDALGRIASKDAAKALAASRPAGDLARHRQNALIACGDRLAAAGEKKAAKEIFADLADNGSTALVKLAGVRGLVSCGETDRVAALLKGGDAELQAGAAQLVGELPSKSAAAVAKELPSFPPALQAAVIRSLGRRADKAGAAEIAALLGGDQADVKLAAIEALGAAGSADEVPALLKIAAGGDDAAKAAVAALQVLPGAAASKAIAKNLAGGVPSAQRAQAVEILGARQAKSEVELLIGALDDQDDAVRNAAAKALRGLAGQAEIKPLAARLKAATDAASAGRIQPVLLGAVDRAADPDAATKQLLAVLEGGDEAKRAVLPVLARVGNAAALGAVRDVVVSGGQLHKDAVRALGDWRNDDALEPLLQIASTDADESAKVIALRGYIRIVAAKKDRKVPEASALIGKALAVATRDEERTSAISSLGQTKGADAVKIAASYLDKPGLSAAAALAISQSAKDLNPKEGKQVLAQVRKAREVARDQKLQKELDALIARFAK